MTTLSRTSISTDQPSLLAQWSTLRAAALVLLLCATASVTLSAQTLTTLLTFNGTDGSGLIHDLVEGRDGNLYGTTEYGGTKGGGTVFKITPQGTLTTLYNFCSLSNCVDGEYPSAALVLGTDGDFYGTTLLGSTTDSCDGTVFKITPQGRLTTLYGFCSQSSGQLPEAKLVQGGDGNFYGTTLLGGDLDVGTLFKITPQGQLTTIHSFCSQTGCADGNYPVGPGMVLGADGNLYGMTGSGGSSYGTVFRSTLAGKLTTLHSFCQQSNCADGRAPIAVVQATDGNLYGATFEGGDTCQWDSVGCGTVFGLTLAGKFTTLYTFCQQQGFCQDGSNPIALVQGSDGDFYGTTQYAGISNGFGFGTIFRISPAGAFATLYSFCSGTNCAAGAYPENLVQSTSGRFFGATEGAPGTIFMVDQDLPRFVRTSPRFGKVGSTVAIFGNGLGGSTSVSFNGTAAAFTVISHTELRATVPAGSTTGKIKVVTAHGTIASDVVFSVVP